MKGKMKIDKKMRFRFPPNPKSFITGGTLSLVGLFMRLLCSQYTIPSDYDLNAFDVIFVIPMLAKMLYYEIAALLAQFGVWFGTTILCIGLIISLISFLAFERSESHIIQ